MGRLDRSLKSFRTAPLAVLAVLVCLTAPVGLALAAEATHDPPPPHGETAAQPGVPQSLEGTDVDAEHADVGEHAADGEHGAGLPQLDVSTFPSQIFWLIVAFGTLYYLMTRKALPRLTDILEARQERIASDLDRAATLRAEAEEALQRYQQVVTAAQTKAAERLKEVQDRLSAEAAQKQAGLEADLDRKLADAEQRIKAAKDAAMGEIQSVAVEVAQTAVRRLTSLEVSEGEVKAALDQVLAEAA